jgi:pimeloyl-ACP methyl ester carboxylesterase
MRDVPGRPVPVNGRAVYVEESGQGQDWVVFEAGGGCGRTFWDPVVPLLAGQARLVAYDRAGRALSGRTTVQLSIDDLADDLVAMTESVVPGDFVLVAHSMGGLVARRAADRLGSRLRGLVLADTLPESSPVYDDWGRTARKVDRMLAVTQALTRVRPLARLFAGGLRRLYAEDTYQAMLAEDFTPDGTAQTRQEIRAVTDGIGRFRAQPPPLPQCPAIMLSVTRAARGRERQHALNREHQRQYAGTLPNGRYDVFESAHFLQAEQPQSLARCIEELCQGAV